MIFGRYFVEQAAKAYSHLTLSNKPARASSSVLLAMNQKRLRGIWELLGLGWDGWVVMLLMQVINRCRTPGGTGPVSIKPNDY